MKKQKAMYKNSKGQGVMEYVILSSLIGIFCLGIIGQYGDALKTRIDYMKKSVVKALDRDIYSID